MRPTCTDCEGTLTRDDDFWYCEKCDQKEREFCKECDEYRLLTNRSMCRECDENFDYCHDIRKACDAGKTKEEQISNMQKVMADYHLKELIASAHPDSILGCMGKLREALDNFNKEKVERSL